MPTGTQAGGATAYIAQDVINGLDFDHSVFAWRSGQQGREMKPPIFAAASRYDA